MDYSHAQRVLANHLLVRSFTTHFLDKHGRVSLNQYWRAPTDEYGRMLPTVTQVGPPDIPSPVLGVGIGEAATGDERIVLLTEVETGAFDAKALVISMGLEGVQVEEIRGGRAISTARPAEGGESLGHSNGDTGTFGCLVKNGANVLFLLSCNHVIAALNKGQKGVDAVWQPGMKDGGSVNSRIGVLDDFAKIITGGHMSNRIDAALCKPDQVGDVSSKITSIGALSGAQSISLGASVRKSGAKTGLTKGKIRLNNLSVIVDYPGGVQALFDGQLGIIGTEVGKNFSDQGDSGSIVVDDQNCAVGLLISCLSGVDLTIANPIQEVLAHFQVTI